jgi:hypothetical protein
MLNTSPLCLTAAAGTELAGEVSFDESLLNEREKGLQPKAFSDDFVALNKVPFPG